MQLKTYLLALTSLVLLGCAHTESLSTVHATYQQGEPFALSLLKPASVDGLTLRLVKTEDSRCPTNAQCIWAGVAVAHVQLQDPQGATASQKLYLGESLPVPDNRGRREADTVNVPLGTKTYQLILSEITPYPSFPDPKSVKKRARISVRAL